MRDSELYLPSGYLNMHAIMNIPVNFIFVMGARGIGKTYGAIQELVKNKQYFALIRRTQMQSDLIALPETCPLSDPVNDMGLDLSVANYVKSSKKFYNGDTGQPYCFTGALSTFGNMRGMPTSDATWLLFDEFVAQPGEKKMKRGGEMFLQMFETLNRNRELKGIAPIKCVLTANSYSMRNEIFLELGLITKTAEMIKKHQSIYINKNRELAIIIPYDSPVSERKKETVLYKLADGTDFEDMAINNLFVNDDSDDPNIRPMPLKDYRPYVEVGEIAIYKHKSDRLFYACHHKSGTPADSYSSRALDLVRYRRKYGILWLAHLRRQIFFEKYVTQVLFEEYNDAA